MNSREQFSAMAVISQALIAMIFLYLIRLVPLPAAFPIMAVCGIPMICASVEENIPFSLGAALATALFGLIFVADFSYLCPAILFFLPYGAVKPVIDTSGDAFLRWSVKIIWFCAAMGLCTFFAGGTVLRFYLEHISLILLVPLLLILFVLYDYVLFLAARFYAFYIRRRL